MVGQLGRSDVHDETGGDDEPSLGGIEDHPNGFRDALDFEAVARRNAGRVEMTTIARLTDTTVAPGDDELTLAEQTMTPRDISELEADAAESDIADKAGLTQQMGQLGWMRAVA